MGWAFRPLGAYVRPDPANQIEIVGMNEKIRYWMEMAEYDLETGKVMLEGGRFLYVGFMCHQTIEKVLKGYYVSARNENPPYTHNLAFLAKEAGLHNKMTEGQKDFIDLIEPLNVEARYPTHKGKLMQTLDHHLCMEILRETEELYRWIKRQLLPG
jgi:HEPN domain-containing protein